uniref:Thiamine biosynthetic bifunctional n=1 Tax=Colletotrichum fructicola (strain Nara gc5) TaxID=1213859 RepID=L2FYH6_COLFN
MPKPQVDYALYLVTDSTPAILGDRDLGSVVAAAVKGGVTCVQYRNKTKDTGDLVAEAKKLHEVTRAHGVPLLINDRVDVALAVGCEGVHIGQDDMDLTTARKLLGPDVIIGVTASTIDEALKACDGGADYLGIGTVFATSTSLPRRQDVKSTNIQRVLYQSATPAGPAIDGVAVVSAIVAAEDPEAESRRLLELVRSSPSYQQVVKTGTGVSDVKQLVELVPEVVKAVAQASPLSHNMTNLVSGPKLRGKRGPRRRRLSHHGQLRREAPDLARLGGALVINMGTVTPDGLANYIKALAAYNAAKRPVVFDPVGAGATAIRRSAVKTILSGGYLDLIKGNEGEIATVYGQSLEQQKGVDSSSTLSHEQKAKLVKDLASRERNVVLMTGKTDYVSDGVRTFAVENGHELLGQITGTGCVLGTTISAMLAAKSDDKLLAVVAGLLHFEIAAEHAAVRGDVQGPGTFVPAFIDELARIRNQTVGGDLKWLSGAKVEAVEVQ